MENMNCLKKSGDSSKPPVEYSTFALVQALCNRKVLVCFSLIVVFLAILFSYYFYLDGLYLVDEVLEGSGPRELSVKEKLTIRVIAPRKVEDLTAFVLEYSVCQPVYEIQVIWLHEQAPPPDSHFKYPHTHSKLTFFEYHGMSAWDSLHGDLSTAETESVMLIDPDVFISCSDIAFAQSVWRSSVNAVVGFFPRNIEWQSDKRVNVRGWTSITLQGRYSLMAAAGMIIRKEYLQSMMYENAQAELKYLDEARAHVRDYVNQHPQCADLALSLWPSGTRALYREHTKTTASTSSSSSNSVSSSVISSSSTPADHKSDPAAAITRFPSSTVSPPIWVDLPSLQIHHGVELTSHPHQQQKHQQAQTVIATSSATTTDAALAVVAPLKVLMTSDMSNACATELVRLLKLTPETLPAARFKSTLASSHIYW